MYLFCDRISKTKQNGINEKIWKVIFGQQVEKYKYVYYESEFVSPKFIYIECDSKN